jgi:hypothetical protein
MCNASSSLDLWKIFLYECILQPIYLARNAILNNILEALILTY